GLIIDAMRIVMPLFEYASTGVDSYVFKSFPFCIEPLRAEDIIETKLFSEQDIDHIRLESWCLVFTGDEVTKYVVNSNLLLMAFRISEPCKAPFIKYRVCGEDLHHCRRLNDPMTHNYESGLIMKVYSLSNLEKIDTYLGRLIEMNTVSNRTKNALYFAFRGMSAAKWIDAFLMYMSAIESLFSKDKPGGATETIKTRVASLLNSAMGVTKEDVGALYALRSNMVHGHIEINDDPHENLRELAKIQRLLNSCLNIFLERELYKHYASKTKRDNFMGTLNGP
ncbi:MAG: hypothetical protein ACRERV_04395, partial [Methylococcales bacterium]